MSEEVAEHKAKLAAKHKAKRYTGTDFLLNRKIVTATRKDYGLFIHNRRQSPKRKEDILHLCDLMEAALVAGGVNNA